MTTIEVDSIDFGVVAIVFDVAFVVEVGTSSTVVVFSTDVVRTTPILPTRDTFDDALVVRATQTQVKHYGCTQEQHQEQKVDWRK